MQFRRQSRDEEGVNLTPLIDVVFLLLIFFMVTTTFTKESHLNIDLPVADGDKAVAPAQVLEIVIAADGAYSLNGKALVNNQLDTLVSALAKVAGDDLQQPLIITADAKTPHQAVVTAMEAAGRSGLVNLSITTREQEAQP